jgi:hypothetical protein
MEINGRKLDVKIASPKGNRPPKKEVVEKKPFEKKPFEKRPFNNDRRFDSRNQNREGNRPYQATSDRPKRNFDN